MKHQEPQHITGGNENLVMRDVSSEPDFDTLIWNGPRPDVDDSSPSRLKRFANAANIGMVALELNPWTNEGMRALALAGAATMTRDPVISAATFAAATFGIESVGVFGTSRLFASEGGERGLSKVQAVLEKWSPFRRIQEVDSLALDTALSFTAGPPSMLAVKNIQNPSRSYSENLSYGMKHSAAVALGTGSEVLLVGESWANPNKFTLTGVALGIAGIAAGIKWGKEKQLRSSTFSYEDYRKNMDRSANGPHIEGYNDFDYQQVLSDQDTRYITLKGGVKEKRQRWPVLSPIRNSTEYMPDYFTERYDEKTPIYYLSAPDLDAIVTSKASARELARHISDLKKEGAIIVFDEMDGQKKAQALERLTREYAPDVRLTAEEFVDPKNDTSAASVHYTAIAERKGGQSSEADDSQFTIDKVRAQYRQLVANGEIVQDEASKTVLLDPELMNDTYRHGGNQTVLDRMWDIYKQRFDWLIEENPSRGKQTAEEFKTMVLDPNTLTAAHMVNGEIAAIAMFVGDIQACDWLRPDYYKEQYGDETLLYFPGIASDESLKGSHFGLNICNLLSKVVSSATSEVRLVWQCTNVSADYIPKIVHAGVNLSDTMKLEEPKETVRYNYRGVKIS